MVLNDPHKDRLRSHYGIDPDHPSIVKMEMDGMLASVDQDTARKILSQDVPAGGILIKYPNSETLTIRLDQSKKSDDGRKCKYLHPVGAKNELYVPPGINIQNLDEIWITEGELKALRSSIDGLPVIALSGIWNWRNGQAKDDLAGLIDDLDNDWKGKRFVLIYDSDITPTHIAHPSFQRLADVLYSHGARRVKIVTLPELKGLKKTGLDDFLNGLGESAISRLRSLVNAASYVVPGELGVQRFVKELHDRSEKDPDIETDIELATKALIMAGKEAEAQDILRSVSFINAERRRAFISDAKHYAKAKKTEAEETLNAALSQKLRYELRRDQVNQEVIKIEYSGKNGSERSEYTYSNSSKLKKWIIDQVELLTGKTPDRNLVDKIKSSITAQYLHPQPELIVGRRFLKIGDSIYYNLNDNENRVLHINANEIKIVSDNSGLGVAFVNPSQALAQTMPDLTAEPTDIDVLFSEGLLNITDPVDQMIYKVLLSSSLATDGPRYIACFHGEAGAGKSSVAEVIKRLLDPEKASRQKVPSSPDGRKSLFNNRDVVLLDNVTTVPEWLLNDLCLASTGGHDVDRMLYTDFDEVLIDLHKLVVLTGVNSVGSWRSDFVDRCIVFKLKRIENVQDETAIWKRFEELRPRLFGAVINTAKKALELLPQIPETGLTRISTGSRFGEACARALGYEPNEFLDALKRRHEMAHIQTACTDAVGEAILLFMQDRPKFDGSFSDLHRELSYLVPDDTRRQRSWPKNGQSLSRKVNQIRPSLRAAGVDIEDDPDSKRGIIIINLKVKREAQPPEMVAVEVDKPREKVSMPNLDAMDGITEIAPSNNRDASRPSDALDAKTQSSLPFKEIYKRGNENNSIKKRDNASVRQLSTDESMPIDFVKTQIKSIASNCARNCTTHNNNEPQISCKPESKGKKSYSNSFDQAISVDNKEMDDDDGAVGTHRNEANPIVTSTNTNTRVGSHKFNDLDPCAVCGNSFPAYAASFFRGFNGPVCRRCSSRLHADKFAKKNHPKDDAEMLFYYGWLKRVSIDETNRLTREIEEKAKFSVLEFTEEVSSEVN